MIRVFNLPAITWTLTAVLLLSGIYHVLQATRSHRLTDRVNNSLHALMNVLMAAMLWNLVPSAVLVQIALLTAAALWFVIQAVARPEFKMLCASSQGRLKCLYHSLAMAGAALMVAMMATMTATGHGTVPAGGITMSNGHHAMAAPAQSTAAAAFDHSSGLAVLLAVMFGAAAVVFIVRLLRFREAKPAPHNARVPRHSGRADHGIEALGAAVMALMFATMA